MQGLKRPPLGDVPQGRKDGELPSERSRCTSLLHARLGKTNNSPRQEEESDEEEQSEGSSRAFSMPTRHLKGDDKNGRRKDCRQNLKTSKGLWSQRWASMGGVTLEISGTNSKASHRYSRRFVQRQRTGSTTVSQPTERLSVDPATETRSHV